MSETTHIICAHCGADNAVSNGRPSDGTINIYSGTDGMVLGCLFKCRSCISTYPLPVTVRSPNTKYATQSTADQ